MSQPNSDSATEPNKERDKYYAPIKKEYLYDHHRPKLATSVLPTEVAKEISDQLEKEAQGEPKAKFKGRNRNNQRPVYKAENNNFCSYAAQGLEPCPYGESCRLSHDTKKVMEERDEDISESCHVYETFGYCRFGVLCRFGGCHLNDDGSNKVGCYEKWLHLK